MRTIHTLILAASALAAGLPQLASSFPAGAAPYLGAGQAVLILLVAVLGVIDPPSTSRLARRK